MNTVLTIDQSGVLWVATADELVRFARESGNYTVYDERDDLLASAVHGILADRNENLWVSTLSGLSRLNPRTGAFTNYYETDGLAGNAFEGYPATCRSQRGQMSFGSKSELTSFWPEQIVEKPSIPPGTLTESSLRNRPMATGLESLLAQPITSTHYLTRSHEQKTSAFEFAALSYVDPLREPLPVQARETRPFLQSGGPRSPGGYLHDAARTKLDAAGSWLDRSRGVQ